MDLQEFEPIWIKGETVLEGLSDEVREMANYWPHATLQLVGSMRTILHMTKCDDLVVLDR
ncbi:hypothetical protein FQN54_009657 [Arachnomyces sp. PD_36]|nr:hypothetical protein FQN54_009657 [Arachnomyces sp. PD_36]